MVLCGIGKTHCGAERGSRTVPVRGLLELLGPCGSNVVEFEQRGSSEYDGTGQVIAWAANLEKINRQRKDTKSPRTRPWFGVGDR